MMNGNSKSETTFVSNEPTWRGKTQGSKRQYVLLVCINFMGPIMARVQRLLGRPTTEKRSNMLCTSLQAKKTYSRFELPEGLSPTKVSSRTDGPLTRKGFSSTLL